MTHLKREKSRNKDYGRHTKRFGQKEIRRAKKTDRRWFKAVVEQLEEVGFYNIERDIKLENLEEIDEETWVQYYSVPDRRYIYTAVKATLSQAANDAYENEKKNGILLLHRLWKLHGAPNLANTISALTELLNIETTMHQDPAPNLQSLERILTEFFPGTPDNMKIALLMRTVNTDKYRSILDSMKIPGMVIPTYLELKQAVQNHYATDRAEHEQKMKGGKRKAQQEENRTPKPKISPHAALATAVAAEVRRPSRKTRQRSLRMKGFLNSSVHSCATTVGKSRSNIPPAPAPTHALEEDADAEAVVQREAADEDTAADTPSMDRSTSRTLNASNVGSLGITPTSVQIPRKTEIRHRY
ncbi:hypothetical protein RI054_19g87510 [Pseudoscourfieldia marina]